MEFELEPDSGPSRKRRMVIEEDGVLSHGHMYPVVNLHGNARAILGNVHDPKSSFFPEASEADRKTLMLKSLYFDGMRSRKQQIDARAGSPKSIDWIWSTSYVDWLKSSDNFFWITGRPGSGKSTLMKHIADSRKTIMNLQHDGQQWTAIHFFFDFRAASGLPNRIDGMLRSLLYQLTQRVKGLADSLLDDAFKDVEGEISLQRCLDLVCDAIEATPSRVCAFIDGLDECANVSSELLETINVLEDRTGIKICLASRPEPIFFDELSKVCHLTIQNHNHGSIRFYAENAFKNARIGPWAKALQTLSEKLQEKANGVFLWARLAVDELVQAFMAGKSGDELQQILQTMPTEVEEMYQRILDNLPTILQTEAAILSHLILNARPGVSIHQLFVALGSIVAKYELVKTCHPVDLDGDVQGRLNASIGSLLDIEQNELDHMQPTEQLSYTVVPRNLIQEEIEVRFMHETVRTFFASSNFLRKNSPVQYQNLYSDFPWIKIYAEEISQCSAIIRQTHLWGDDKITAFIFNALQIAMETDFKSEHGRQQKIVNFLEGWPHWTPLLVDALKNLLEEVKRVDDVALGQVYQAIESAIGDQIFLLHCAVCCIDDELYCSSLNLRLFIQTIVSRMDSVNQIMTLAALHQMQSLMLYTLSKHSEPIAQDVLDFLFNLSAHVFSSMDWDVIFENLAARGSALDVQSLYTILSNEWPLHDTKIFRSIRKLSRALSYPRSYNGCLTQDVDRRDTCLLSLWAVKTLSDVYYGQSHPEAPQFLLEWISEVGHDINKVCGSDGTVINYLFALQFSLKIERNVFLRLAMKFRALFRAGISLP